MIGFQVSMFGGSAWTWVGTRQQYYFHTYLKEQPDLNFQHHKVRTEMQVIIEQNMNEVNLSFPVILLDYLLVSQVH